MSTPTPLTYIYKAIPATADTPALDLSLDVYLPPSKSTEPVSAPIVFAFHPGGFISYGRDHIPPWITDLAREKGWIVVSPDYRLLIGKDKLDAGDVVQDVLDAYEWAVGGRLEEVLGREGRGVGVDKRRVGAVGWSIGGYLTHLLPSLIPTHLPPITSIASLYAVTRPLHPFYSTPRTPSTPSDPSISPSLNTTDPPLPSLNLPASFHTTSSTLFAKLLSSPTPAGEGDYTPSEKRALEAPGADGYRGMLWDWCVETGLVLPLWLGLPLPDPYTSPHATKHTSPTSSEVTALKERLQPLVGPNSPKRDTHPDAFVVHGDADTLVPWEESLWAVGRLCQVGVKARYVSVPGVDHGWDGAMGVDEEEGLFREIGEWLEGSWRRRDGRV